MESYLKKMTKNVKTQTTRQRKSGPSPSVCGCVCEGSPGRIKSLMWYSMVIFCLCKVCTNHLNTTVFDRACKNNVLTRNRTLTKLRLSCDVDFFPCIVNVPLCSRRTNVVRLSTLTETATSITTTSQSHGHSFMDHRLELAIHWLQTYYYYFHFHLYSFLELLCVAPGPLKERLQITGAGF